MKWKKTTEVTREWRRLLRVRLPGNAATDWCPACGADVPWVSVREAAGISGLAEREVHRRVESGALHFLESSGALLVCFLSLTRSMR